MGVGFGAYVRVTLTSSDGFNVPKGYSDLAGAAASSNVIFDIVTFYLPIFSVIISFCSVQLTFAVPNNLITAHV